MRRFAGVDIADLARAAESKEREISQLTLEQEREILATTTSRPEQALTAVAA